MKILACGVLIGAIIMPAPVLAQIDIGTRILDRVLSECGLLSAMPIAAVIWLAWQLAKTRAAWETDRSQMMRIISAHNTSFENLSATSSRLEGMLLAVRKPL